LIGLAGEFRPSLIASVISNTTQKIHDVDVNIDVFIVQINVDYSFSIIFALAMQFV
jgi:hypothetical protein